MGTKLFFKTKKAFIEFIKNKSDFTIEIINETDDWIIFKCEAKINKPRCGTGGTGGNRMTLNKLAEIVLNLSNTVETLSNTVETGFANVNQRLDKVESRLDKVESRLDKIESRLDKIESRLDNLEKDVSVLKQDVADIKRCPTIQKELSELTE